MIIDGTNIDALNETIVSEIVPPDISFSIGVLFIFIGIMFLIGAWVRRRKEGKKLKNFMDNKKIGR